MATVAQFMRVVENVRTHSDLLDFAEVRRGILALLREFMSAFEGQYGVSFIRAGRIQLGNISPDKEITGVSLAKLKEWLEFASVCTGERYLDWCGFESVAEIH